MVVLRSVSPINSITRSQFRTSKGVLIDYAHYDRGSDISIVFINGWGTTHTSEWAAQTNLPFNLLFHNSRGMGTSTIDNDPYLDAAAKDVSELVRYLGLVSAHYVGHSMGGLVFARFNRSYSEGLDVRSASLVCSPAGNPLTTFPLRRIIPNDVSSILRSFEGGFLGLAAGTVSNAKALRSLAHLATRGGGVMLDSDSFADLYRNFLTNRRGVVAALESMIALGDQVATDFSHISSPALVVSGRRDFFVSPAATSAILGRISGAQHFIFDDATHAPMFESPDGFNRLLAQFVVESHGVSGTFPTPR